MSRVKRGVTAHARHKKVLKLARGFMGRCSKCFRPAIERLEKSWQYSYRDRRVKKRNFRSLWIQRINAVARSAGLKYSVFIDGLKKANVSIDRKMLSRIAFAQPDVFGHFVSISTETLAKTK